MTEQNGVRKLAYFDRGVEMKVILAEGAEPHGVREVRMRWVEDPRIVVSRTIKGDFTQGTGEVLIPNHTIDEF